MEPQIERLLKNYSNARRSWEVWCFMVNFNLKEKSFDTAQYISTNELLSHLRYLAMKDFYIEMYKILKRSNNNKDNIFVLLKNLKLSNKYKSQEVENSLSKLEQTRLTIDSICTVRDKFYAHLDKDYEKYLSIGIPLNDILKCFKAIETSIITLTSLKMIRSYLDKIPSRDELRL